MEKLEFESWSKITPLSERFLRYARFYNFGSDRKLRLADLVEAEKGLDTGEYHKLCVDLALRGYELKLVEGSSKYKVFVEILGKAYSYFELVPGELLKEIDRLRNEPINVDTKTAGIIDELKKENERLKNSKAGQKSLNDRDTVTLIYDKYAKGESLAAIADSLNNTGCKTKRGGQWYKSTIKYILQNYEYVSTGLIDEGTFMKIQEELKSRRLGSKEK